MFVLKAILIRLKAPCFLRSIVIQKKALVVKGCAYLRTVHRKHGTAKEAIELWSASKSCLPWILSFQCPAAPDAGVLGCL